MKEKPKCPNKECKSHDLHLPLNKVPKPRTKNMEKWYCDYCDEYFSDNQI
jgi:aspartate carbamoyltransferase regulatory subunit